MERSDPVRFLQVELARLGDENRDLKDELQVLRSSVRALSTLQEIIQRITPTTDVLVLLDDLLASAVAVVGASDGSLLLLDEDTDELVFAVVHGEARDRLSGYRLPPGKGIAGWVAANKRPLFLTNVRDDSRFYPKVDEAFGFHTRSLAAVPLLDGDRVLGALEAITKNYDREFTDVDHDLLMIVGHLASVALSRAEAFAKEADEEEAAKA
ncbi:MAG: GAF domain-containing protein [Anaerolineales bacterium]